MIKLFFTCAVLSISIYAQNLSDNPLHSAGNIKAFADYLYCEEDYLRAAEEYVKYLDYNYIDTVEFKIALANLKIGNYSIAEDEFKFINERSNFYSVSRSLYFQSIFLNEDYSRFRNLYQESDQEEKVEELYFSSFLLTDDELPYRYEFLDAFPESVKDKVERFYERKRYPDYKDPLLAAVLSAVIPGAGKFYTENYSDGITALIITGLFGYLSYSNFEADHKFRGWLFGGLSAFFYAGNVYGSATSAQLFNARVQFNFEEEFKLFLNENNYFIEQPEFCNE